MRQTEVMRRRSAALVGLTLLAGTFLANRAPDATACSCAMPPPVEHRIGMHDVAFVGTPISDTRIRVAEGSRFEHYGKDLWTIRVNEAFKGVLPTSVQILTDNGENSTCSGAPFEVGKPLAILAQRTPDGVLRSSYACGWSSVNEADLRSRADLPAPGGGGPIAALVAARDRDAALFALNADRDVVAYGFVSEDVVDLAPCAGHEYFVTLDNDAKAERWHAATMISEFLASPATDQEAGAIYAYDGTLACTSPDGSTAIALRATQVEHGIEAVATRLGVDTFDPITIDNVAALAVVPYSGEIVTIDDGSVSLLNLESDHSDRLLDLPAGFEARHAGVAPDAGRLWVSGLLDGDATIVTADLHSGVAGPPIPTTALVQPNATWISRSQIVFSGWTEAGGDEKYRLDVEARTTTPITLPPGPVISSFGDGTVVVSDHWSENPTYVVESDGSTNELLPDAWSVNSVYPFAGPEVTPEAAAKVRADDLDLTAFANDSPNPSDPPADTVGAATAEISVESGDGVGVVPIAVGAGTAAAALAGWVVVRRRKRASSEPCEKSVF